MTLNFNLNNFVRICALDSAQQVSKVDEYLNNSSGFPPYYSPLLRSIDQKIIAQDLQFDPAIVQGVKQETKRKKNSEALSKFVTWALKSKIDVNELKRSSEMLFCNRMIKLKCTPTFIRYEQNEPVIYFVWPFQGHPLSSKFAGVLLYGARRILNDQNLDNYSFSVLDLSSDKAKVFKDKNHVRKNSKMYFQGGLASISGIYQSLLEGV